MSSADDKDSVSSAARIAYPKALLNRQHEVSFSPLTGLWFVSIIGSDQTFVASANTLKEAAKEAIAKTNR